MADFEDKTPRPLVLIYGCLQTKDPKAFLRHFNGLASEVVALPVSGEQVGRAPGDISAVARGLGFKASVAAGFETGLRDLAAREWTTPPRILIAGSLYLVGEVLTADGSAPD